MIRRMTKSPELFRWSILLACIVLGLLQLNGAVQAAWIADGPPVPNPEGWLFLASNRFAWSVGSFLAGMGLFLILRPARPAGKAAVAALVAAVLLMAIPFARESFATHSCLDSGGQWSDAELRCLRSDTI